MENPLQKTIDESMHLQIEQLRERLKKQKRIRNPVFSSSTIIEKKEMDINAPE